MKVNTSIMHEEVLFPSKIQYVLNYFRVLNLADLNFVKMHHYMLAYCREYV